MKKFLLICLIVLMVLCFARLEAQLSFQWTGAQQPPCWDPLGTVQTVSVTASPLGTTSYSWLVTSPSTCGYTSTTTNPFASLSLGTCCGTYSITCFALNSSNAVISSTMMTTTIACPTWLTFTTFPSSGLLCSGTTGTITAGGAMTYTWSTLATAGQIIVTPTSSQCYTLGGTNAAGCTLFTTACFSVFPFPSLTVTPSSNICAGESQTLTASGANQYTWAPGNVTSPTIVVTPTANTVYSVTGTNGCAITYTTGIYLNPLPNVGIGGPTSICPGDTVTLTASGANTYTWTDANFGNIGTGSSVNVSPSGPSCYTLTGADAMGCVNHSVMCIGVNSPPNISISGAPMVTVCAGSSTSLLAMGAASANSYTWNTIPPTVNSASLSLIPNNGCTLLSVSGLGSNGCIGTATVYACADTSCANVWPGDANSDGVVNSSDILELGLQASHTGPVRAPGGNAWNSQQANAWIGYVSNGKNKCHADCNGDGTVNANDTVAVYNNYMQTHSFKPSGSSSAGDINLVSQNNYILEGSWNKVDIELGTNASPVSQIYGVMFDIDLDNAVIQNNMAYVVYTASFLDASSQNIIFRKVDAINNKIYGATVRTSGGDVSGSGKIGELWFFAKSGLPANSSMNLSVSNTGKISKNGTSGSLTGGNSTVPVLATAPVGITQLVNIDHATGFFPNPAANQLTMVSSLNSNVNYTIYDVSGRILNTGAFNGSKSLDLSSFAAGSYFI
ncbi:MAG: T9SS type A sorting domain-containing protein, partial [Bacteroidia bacterium]|nr:T9SS type A sorting domain-containing protein [Bacteroidia bacterium]